jgi:hypothetical protein
MSLCKFLPIPDGGLLIMNAPHQVDAGSTDMRGRQWRMHSVRAMLEYFLYSCTSNPFAIRDRVRGLRAWMQWISGGLEGASDLPTSVFQARPPLDAPSAFFSYWLDTVVLRDIALNRRRNALQIAHAVEAQESGARLWRAYREPCVPLALPVLHHAADTFSDHLKKRGIGAARWPNGDLPDSVRHGDFPVANRLSATLVLLPVHQDLSERDVGRILSTIRVPERIGDAIDFADC